MSLNLKIESQVLENDFERIASEIMNDWILQVEASKYRITEIEFYFKSDKHLDNYTHGHEIQKKIGHWYFHGSGVDITFGNDNYYGGILIRALYNLDSNSNKYIYGPIKVVTELLGSLTSVYYNTFALGLISDKEKSIQKEKPIAAPRVGLNSKTDPTMHEKLYRFLVMPKMQHAEKTNIVEAMKQQGYTDEEVNNIWG